MIFIDMPDALRDLALWDQLTPQQGEQLARFVEMHLPAAWRFSHMASYEVGTQKRQVAHFHWQPATERAPVLFSLIPGATATLGFDRAHPFPVVEELVLDWQKYVGSTTRVRLDPATTEILAREPEIPHDELFYDYLVKILHPLRTVTLRPLLVEVEPEEASAALPPPRYVYRRMFDNTSRKRSKLYASRWGRIPIPQRHVAAFLRDQGFRLLTAEEWEYVCAAGSRELFYWWNEECDFQGNASSWEELRNAFGLAIARDAICLDTDHDYEYEYCADPTIIKGSGSSMLFCDTLSYLPFAPAYYNELSEKERAMGISDSLFRRAFDLVEEESRRHSS